MATCLSSVLLAALLAQAPPAGEDSLAALWARVRRDSSDGRAWLVLGRAYVRLSAAYHAHRAAADTAWARARLDTAEDAFERAARFGTGTRAGDSARVFRVFVWGERALLAWETGGIEAAAAAWQAIPTDLRLPPVLEELGENVLRACPAEGVLLTAGEADTYAAWYMRFARGLRPDLLILPLGTWQTDTALRARVARDLKLPARRPRGGDDPALRTLVQRRPLCASMGFERPPELRPRVRWTDRPLVWVTGPRGKEQVSAQDFVFTALRLALDQHEPWSDAALGLYRRAAATTPALCKPLETFGLAGNVGCRD